VVSQRLPRDAVGGGAIAVGAPLVYRAGWFRPAPSEIERRLDTPLTVLVIRYWARKQLRPSASDRAAIADRVPCMI